MNRLATALGGVSAEALLRPVGVPRVRAGSRYPDQGIAPPAISRKEAGRRKKALRIEAARRRVAGRRCGGRWKPDAPQTIGPHVIAVFDVMIDWAAGHGGLVELAVGTIAEWARCSAETVHRAKTVLKSLGMLDWIRQCEPTGLAGQRGPQVRQIPNRYLFPTPGWAQRLFDAWFGPPPDDEVARKAAMAAAIRAQAKADEEAASPAIARAQAKADRASLYTGDP
jgi:hypothetical protein